MIQGNKVTEVGVTIQSFIKRALLTQQNSIQFFSVTLETKGIKELSLG